MRRPRQELTDRVVAITGAARGIGAATARAVAAAGGRVAIGDLDGELAAAVGSSLGGFGERLDVTDPDAFDAFLDHVEDRLGPLDVLINNAGIMTVGPFAEEPAASISRQLEINVRAVLDGTQQAVRRMLPRGHGHIVNVASSAGRAGFPGIVTYCTTKYAIVGLCEALHAELRGTGIELSRVMPAIVRTDLTDGIKDHWLIKTSTPEQVADAIVGVLRRPRLDVYVPRTMGGLYRTNQILPRAAQDWLLRVTGADHIMADAAHSPDRAAYERRALETP